MLLRSVGHRQLLAIAVVAGLQEAVGAATYVLTRRWRHHDQVVAFRRLLVAAAAGDGVVGAAAGVAAVDAAAAGVVVVMWLVVAATSSSCRLCAPSARYSRPFVVGGIVVA